MLERQYSQVGVGHAEAVYDHADAFRPEQCAELPGELLAGAEHMIGEIGSRMALGAQRSRCSARSLVRDCGSPCLARCSALPGGWALARFVASLLYGVSATDPVSFIVRAPLVLATAAGASFVPARRASRMSGWGVEDF